MNLCEYGCGREANHQFKNGKWCCSSNHKQCPGLSYTTPKIKKVECPYCKKKFSSNRIKIHKNVCQSYNICLQCGEKTKNPKFCNNKCAALYNNKHSKNLRSFQDKKIQQGKLNRSIKRKLFLESKNIKTTQKTKENKCLYCGSIIKSSKFCNNSCRAKFNRNIQISEWLNGKLDGCSKAGHASYVKHYLLEKYDNKCSVCGWGEINPYTKTLPLEVEHIDGNAYNNDPSNVTLLCPNCHSLTKTYRGANGGNGKRKYLKKYY